MAPLENDHLTETGAGENTGNGNGKTAVTPGFEGVISGISGIVIRRT